MKKSLVLVTTTALVVAMVASSAPAQAAGNPKIGAKCATAGETKTVYASKTSNKGKTFTCVAKNKKNVWSKPVDTLRVQTKISVSQVWTGNKVTLSVLDSAGNNCALDAQQVAGAECKGFYLGWKASFNDADRTVDYSVVETTTISNLQLGDKGQFLLMYQVTADSQPVVIKSFPFSYSY
jgi:hypothetical protein